MVVAPPPPDDPYGVLDAKQAGVPVKTVVDRLIAIRNGGPPHFDVYNEVANWFDSSKIRTECPNLCTVNDPTVTDGHLHYFPKPFLYPGDHGAPDGRGGNYAYWTAAELANPQLRNEWYIFCQNRDCLARPNPLCKFPFSNHVCSKCGMKVA
jgi:hypothetical protein